MQSSVDGIAKEEFMKESALFSELNREQLLSGTDAEGQSMIPYVAGSRAPSAPGKTTLKDSGDYHRGIKTLFDSGGVNMTSTDSKFAFLDPKYDTALGINENSQNILIEKVKPKVINRLKNI